MLQSWQIQLWALQVDPAQQVNMLHALCSCFGAALAQRQKLEAAAAAPCLQDEVVDGPCFEAQWQPTSVMTSPEQTKLVDVRLGPAR